MTHQEIYERCVLEAERQNSTAQRIQAKQMLVDAAVRQAINIFNATVNAQLTAMLFSALRPTSTTGGSPSRSQESK